MGERRFNDKEMSAIIQRATELQMEVGPGDKTGTTLGQIQQAAAELGISPDLVERAAGDLGTLPAGRRFSFFGGPTRAAVSLEADGTLREEDWPIFLQEVRKISGRVGTVRPAGGAFEWISQSPSGMHLSVTPKHGKSLIDIRLDLGPTALLTILLPMLMSLVWGLGLIGLAGATLGFPLWLVLQALIYSVGRYFFSRSSRRQIESIRDLGKSLSDYIEASTESATEAFAQVEPLQQRLTSQ